MITRKMIHVHDLELHVSTYGVSEEAIPVVIVHGFMDHHIAWEEIALSLSEKGIPVISYDQRGHGRSSHVASSSQYHFPDYISDLHRLLENLNISKCQLIGHSMGGMLAQIVSADFSDNVNKLVLSCTHKGYALPPKSPLRKPYSQRLEERKKLSNEEFGKLRIKKMLPELKDKEIFSFLSIISEEITEGSIMSGGMAMQTLDTSTSLLKVNQPCLILKGSKDIVVSNDRSNRLQQSLPHAKVLELSNVGHAPYCENSSDFNEAIETFFNS